MPKLQGYLHIWPAVVEFLFTMNHSHQPVILRAFVKRKARNVPATPIHSSVSLKDYRSKYQNLWCQCLFYDMASKPSKVIQVTIHLRD